MTKEKRQVTQQQRQLLLNVLGYLCKLKASEVPGVVKGSEVIVSDPGLLIQFVEGLYDHWRRMDRFLVLSDESGGMKPRTALKENVENMTILIRNTNRDIKENLSAKPPRIFRQIRAGVEITAITAKHPSFPLSGVYGKLSEVPVVRNIVIAPPLILNPPMNKRKGKFVKAVSNPVEAVTVEPKDWLCYPAKAGELLLYVYIHNKFIDLGLSLCNLFEIADDSELLRKPDAVYLYGVEGRGLDGLGEFPTVFWEDGEQGIMTAGVPGRDEFGYFGYLKKMMLTLHNVIMMKRGRMPFHGAFLQVVLKGGKSANLLMIGDSGAGKSETIEAFRAIGDEYIQDMSIVADDMGSLELGKDGHVIAYGTEIGAFLRVDDLAPGYAFGELDAAIIMSAAQTNARVILPVTHYANVITPHRIDFVLYANNYEEKGPEIERFGTSEDALAVFREGKVMSKGTTASTGIVQSYFANIFGPPEYKELHEELAVRVFTALFNKGVYVGQVRTRLGIKGFERKGPEAGARALLDAILKS